jgi:hypothetical protein
MEGEVDDRQHKRSPRKRRNARIPVGHSERITLLGEQYGM